MNIDNALHKLERQDKVIQCNFKKLELSCDFLDTDESISLDYNLYWAKYMTKFINSILLPQLDKYEVSEFVSSYNRYDVSPIYKCYNDYQLDLLEMLRNSIEYLTTVGLAKI